MLEFWFDPQVSVVKKLMLFLIILVAAIALYIMQPMAPQDLLLFAGTGIIFLICRYCKIHFFAHKPTQLAYRILTWVPIALLLALIFKNMTNGEILLPGALGVSIMALSVCLFSPLSLIHKNTTTTVSNSKK